MTEPDFELLRAVCENSGFEQLLKALADDTRSGVMADIESAHAGQNPTVAAIHFGRLSFLEELPRFFQSALASQKARRKFSD